MSIARSITHRARLHEAQHLAGHEDRGPLAAHRHRAEHEVGEGQRLLDVRRGREHRGHASPAAPARGRPAGGRRCTSSSVTCAPRPSAARAAARPSTPAPRTTKLRGRARRARRRGGCPCRRTRSAAARCRRPRRGCRRSPTCCAHGACPASSSIASMPIAVTSRAREGAEVLGARRGQAPEAEDDLVPLELLVLVRVGREDRGHERAPREDLVPAVGDLRARRLVVGVGVARRRGPRPTPPTRGGPSARACARRTGRGPRGARAAWSPSGSRCPWVRLRWDAPGAAPRAPQPACRRRAAPR